MCQNVPKRTQVGVECSGEPITIAVRDEHVSEEELNQVNVARLFRRKIVPSISGMARLRTSQPFFQQLKEKTNDADFGDFQLVQSAPTAPEM